MYIEFKSSKLKRQCEQIVKGSRAWGGQVALKVVQRLNALKAAQSLEELSHLPPLRCHALRGNRQGQYAMDLGPRHRLVFKPLEESRQVSSDPAVPLERGVRILEVTDYHGT